VHIVNKKHKHDVRKRKRPPPPNRPVDRCPGCWYDLSGLTDQPCPECGMGQDQRTAIYAEFERERTANPLGLRACYELWCPVAAFAVLAVIVSRTWMAGGLAAGSLTLMALCHRLSARAQNPLDTLEEMNRFSTLRVRRRAWAAFNMVMMALAAFASVMLIFIPLTR